MHGSCVQVLAGCVRCSMSAAFTARKLETDQEQSPAHPGNRALLLAQSTLGLFTLQLQHFSPSLRVLLPDVSTVAAHCLHQLFAASFLPWLKTGEAFTLCRCMPTGRFRCDAARAQNCTLLVKA